MSLSAAPSETHVRAKEKHPGEDQLKPSPVAAGGEGDPESLFERKKEAKDLGLEELCAALFEQFVAHVERDLKQYFEHVDTKLVFRRVVRSVVPATAYEDVLKRPDLYGPLILAFALASVMHFAFKKADPAPLDHHLLTSLLLAFGSLVVGALLLDVMWQYSAAMAKQSPAKYGLDRAFCIVGYSFFGPCVVMLFYKRIHQILFFPLAVVFGVGSALSFGMAASRASFSQSHAMGAFCALLHLFWLYNLRSVLNTFDVAVEVVTG